MLRDAAGLAREAEMTARAAEQVAVDAQAAGTSSARGSRDVIDWALFARQAAEVAETASEAAAMGEEEACREIGSGSSGLADGEMAEAETSRESEGEPMDYVEVEIDVEAGSTEAGEPENQGGTPEGAASGTEGTEGTEAEVGGAAGTEDVGWQRAQAWQRQRSMEKVQRTPAEEPRTQGWQRMEQTGARTFPAETTRSTGRVFGPVAPQVLRRPRARSSSRRGTPGGWTRRGVAYGSTTES